VKSQSRAVWNVAIILAVAAVVALALFAGVGRKDSGTKVPVKESLAPEVSVAAAKLDTISRSVELPATVEPTRVARLASPAEGPVAQLLVREGDRIRTGQILVVIGRDRGAQAKLTAEREALRKAQDELGRVERLVEKGAIAGEELDRARTDFERANAMAEGSEESAADFRVTAPWQGIVSQVMVQEGNYVAPRSTLMEVFDPSSLVLRLALSESIAMKVSDGAKAEVRLDAVPDRVYSGRLSRLYPELDRHLRTRTAEVTVTDGPALAPGMFARVRLVVETASGTVIPSAAVVATSGQGRSVFVVDEGMAHLREIQTGIEDGILVQVLSGVRPGEVVVVGGQQKLKDKTAVRVKTGTAGARGDDGARRTEPSVPSGGAR